MPDETELNDLVERIAAGDTVAWDELWVLFGDSLRRRARTLLRQYGITGHAESMDICNAVMLDLIRQGEVRLYDSKNLLQYILRAVDNEVRDVLKRLLADRRDIRRNATDSLEQYGVSIVSPSPGTRLIRKEVLQRVREQLGRDHAHVLDLVVAGYGWTEIAKRLGVKPDAVRMRWTRALDEVKHHFGLARD